MVSSCPLPADGSETIYYHNSAEPVLNVFSQIRALMARRSCIVVQAMLYMLVLSITNTDQGFFTRRSQVLACSYPIETKIHHNAFQGNCTPCITFNRHFWHTQTSMATRVSDSVYRTQSWICWRTVTIPLRCITRNQKSIRAGSRLSPRILSAMNTAGASTRMSHISYSTDRHEQ